jgi:transposase
MKNKYIYHSHISERKFREIVRCFEHDFTIRQTTDFTNISRVTVGKLFVRFRKRILTLIDESPVQSGIELYESYFGP